LKSYGIVLVAGASLPADGSICAKLPPEAPSSGALPPYAIVKVVDQRTYVTRQNGCEESWAGNWPYATYWPPFRTWYHVIAIDEQGKQRHGEHGNSMEGWLEPNDLSPIAPHQ
jgi:hypothetical protein